MLFLGYPVAVWVAGLFAGGAVGIAATGGKDAASNLRTAVADAINGALGTQLAGDDLTSAGAFDAALSAWLSGRTGYEVRTLLDKAKLKEDILRAGAGEVSKRSGIPIRDITNREMVKEDLLSAAADQIAARVGIRFTNLADVEAVKSDLLGYGAARLSQDAGIYLSNPTDFEAVKADLRTWGKQQAMAKVAGDLSAALNLPDQDGKRLVELLADQGFKISAQGGAGTIKPKELLKQANGLLLGYAKQELERAAVVADKGKRTLQLRDAQRRFRARHTKKSSPEWAGRPEGQQYVKVSVHFGRDGQVKSRDEQAAAGGVAPPNQQAQAPAAGGVPPALWETGSGNTIKPTSSGGGAGTLYPGGVPPAPARPKGL